MNLFLGIAVIATVSLLAYILWEVRFMRQIAEASHLKDEILAMASGRLWPKYPHGRFEIIMSTSLDQRKYLASLIVYAGAGGEDKAVWRLIVKSRGAHRNAARALEDLQEVLSIHIIKHDGEIKEAFETAITPARKSLDDYVIRKHRAVPYIGLCGEIITRPRASM